ncbi:MAG: helix-turn-helix transcriptional regulator [Clostridia bacterium]|nr:helix-turn-helix transcriptional regulator [Clostridia bacterium]
MGLENLGKRIREERLNKGFTQEQLAEKVNISLNFMSLIENGKNMSVQTLVNLANALDVSIDYLLKENIPYYEDKILNQISQNLQSLNDDEKIYFLNMIKQYRSLK